MQSVIPWVERLNKFRKYSMLSQVRKLSKYHSDLVGAQRFFVSEIQKVLNPRKRKEEIKLIAERFRILDELKNSQESSFAKRINRD